MFLKMNSLISLAYSHQLFYTYCFGLLLFTLLIITEGSSDNAIKMISLWLALCIVIPGIVHQVTAIIYPVNYMTDYLDVSREQRGKF